MTVHVFVDETKHRNYIAVAAIVVAHKQQSLRNSMRVLLLPGQSRIHMNDEKNSRRRAIAAAVVSSGVTAIVYNAGSVRKTHRDARAACFRALVQDLSEMQVGRVVLEQDDTLIDWDRRQLYIMARAAGIPDLRYEHARASSELLLSVPDAVAWCWAKGGDWRRRIEPIVVDVRNL